jgi:hypothetical protein
MELFNHDVSFQKIIRNIWALAYVPLDQVIPIWETIIQDQVRMGCLQWEEDFGPQLASFFKYVDTTWIGELNLRTKIRKKLAYSHDLWNKFKAVLDGDHRTNIWWRGSIMASAFHFLPVQWNGPSLKGSR